MSKVYKISDFDLTLKNSYLGQMSFQSTHIFFVILTSLKNDISKTRNVTDLTPVKLNLFIP